MSKYLDAHAVFSPCGKYRYRLARRWGARLNRRVNFIMLNPSNADGEFDDPTVRRCVNFAKSWDFDALTITNLFAFKATQPASLFEAEDPIGPDNDTHLFVNAGPEVSSLIVCAWGATITLSGS